MRRGGTEFWLRRPERTCEEWLTALQQPWGRCRAGHSPGRSASIDAMDRPLAERDDSLVR